MSPFMRRACLLTLALVLLANTAWAGLPTISYEGQDYVELNRVATLLKARLDAKPGGTEARLTSQGAWWC